MQMIAVVRRWLPERMIVLVTDGGLTAVKLGLRCAKLANPVTYVSRLRLDAKLYDEPPEQPAGKPGPKPKKGARQPSLKERLKDKDTKWTKLPIPWYGGKKYLIEFVSGTSLWHTSGFDPLSIRWVLVRDPAGKPVVSVAEPIQSHCISLHRSAGNALANPALVHLALER